MTSKRMLANAFGQIRFYIKIEPELIKRIAPKKILLFYFMFFSTFHKYNLYNKP